MFNKLKIAALFIVVAFTTMPVMAESTRWLVIVEATDGAYGFVLENRAISAMDKAFEICWKESTVPDSCELIRVEEIQMGEH